MVGTNQLEQSGTIISNTTVFQMVRQKGTVKRKYSADGVILFSNYPDSEEFKNSHLVADINTRQIKIKILAFLSSSGYRLCDAGNEMKSYKDI